MYTHIKQVSIFCVCTWLDMYMLYPIAYRWPRQIHRSRLEPRWTTVNHGELGHGARPWTPHRIHLVRYEKINMVLNETLKNQKSNTPASPRIQHLEQLHMFLQFSPRLSTAPFYRAVVFRRRHGVLLERLLELPARPELQAWTSRGGHGELWSCAAKGVCFGGRDYLC